MEYRKHTKNKRQQGSAVEQKVVDYLVKRNLELLWRNFYSYCGEIDLIMRDQDDLVFIEVRQRNNPYYGDGIMSVNYAKQQKIIKTAKYFLMRYPHYAKMPCRFDVVGVSTQAMMQWVRDAFRL